MPLEILSKRYSTVRPINSQFYFLAFHSDLPLKENPVPVIFVGEEESYLIPIIFMQQGKFKFSAINKFDQDHPIKLNVNSLLTKRYQLINKAKSAEIFGIIIVNSNVKNF